MLRGFEWDEAKAKSNVRKHRVSFEEAADIFDDPMSITLEDPEHSVDKRRFVTIGFSSRDHLLVVCHSDRLDRIRIISSRTTPNDNPPDYAVYRGDGAIDWLDAPGLPMIGPGGIITGSQLKFSFVSILTDGDQSCSVSWNLVLTSSLVGFNFVLSQ